MAVAAPASLHTRHYAAEGCSASSTSSYAATELARRAPLLKYRRNLRAGRFPLCAACVAACWTTVGASEASRKTASSASGSARWPKGEVEVGVVDATLNAMVAAVFDEIERKTFVRFVRVDHGGLTIQRSPPMQSGSGGSGAHRSSGELELCCFDPDGSTRTRRRLAISVVQALGVQVLGGQNSSTATSARVGNSGGSGSSSGRATPISLIEPAEADAINQKYASEVLPSISHLPIVVEIGAYQLAQNYEAGEWSDMVGGRGRRVMAGAMRLAVNLHSSGQLAGLVGALPTFTFTKNKAQVLLVGPESAELMPGSFMPPVNAREGLGAGVRRVTQYARNLPGRSLVGGIPTFLGDGSALLLRSAFTRTAVMQSDETLDDVLQEHHSAALLSQVSHWAQSQGAFLGLPSFVPLLPQKKATASEQDALPNSVEVLLVTGRSSASMQQLPPTKGGGSSFFVPLLLLVLGTCFGILATASTSGVPSSRTMLAAAGALRTMVDAMRRMRHRLGGIRAELDLEDIVNSL